MNINNYNYTKLLTTYSIIDIATGQEITEEPSCSLTLHYSYSMCILELWCGCPRILEP